MKHLNKLIGVATNKLLFIYISIGFILLDLWSKSYISKHFEYGVSYKFINKLFDIRYIHNRGAAFSIFEDNKFILIIPAAMFIIVALYILLFKKHDKVFNTSLALILAGAVGNLYDRLQFGFVRDFIEFKLFEFPIFNLADIYITLAAISIFIRILKKEK